MIPSYSILISWQRSQHLHALLPILHIEIFWKDYPAKHFLKLIVAMSDHTTFNTPRRYCEYNDGRISRRYITRTLDRPQHHVRTDKIGSRHDDWRRRDAIDLQCSTQLTKALIKDREDQLWATNPANRKGVDPLANVMGWFSGHLAQTAWVERKTRCYRRIRPASEQRARKRNTPLHRAYQLAKAEREAGEGHRANVLTVHEQGRLRAAVNNPSFLIMAEAENAEDDALKQKYEREDELKSILATLATAMPGPEQPHVMTPPRTPPAMHPDRLAQLNLASF